MTHHQSLSLSLSVMTSGNRVGLQNAGKTSFVNVVSGGDFVEDMIPTVGFNMRKVTKNKVSIKMWDMGGQERFRNMWERYCRGVTAVVYVLDAADKENFNLAKTELHAWMQKPAVAGVPLLVLGNKSDLENAADARTVIDAMELRRLSGREVCCYCISCKSQHNVDVCLEWLSKHAK